MRNFSLLGPWAHRAFSSENGWLRIRQACIAFVTIAVAFICLLTWQRLRAEQELLDSTAQAQQQSLATIISENLTQVIDRGRTVAVAAESWLSGDHRETEQRLASMLAIDDIFLNLSLYDTSLQRVYSSSPGSVDPLADGELQSALLTVDRTAARTATVLVSSREQENLWAVPVLFPITDDIGASKGFLLVTLDLGYFLGLFRNIDIGRTGVIHILDGNGVELAEARAEGLTHQRQRQKFEELVAAAVADGSYVGDLRGTGPQLANARRVDRAPFIVAVTKELSEVRASHVRSSMRVWSSIAVLVSALGIATWGLLRGFRRQQQLFAALLRSDGEKRSLIAQLEAGEARAVTLASFDHLTGLHNRRLFNELAASHLEVARRSRKHYAVVYMDLDRFKSVNDTLGHHVGDRLLQAVAERLKIGLRSADIVGRMGGDEFAVLLTELDSAESVDVIATKLLHQLSLPYPDLDGHDVQTSPSMGIAFFRAMGTTSTACAETPIPPCIRPSALGVGAFRTTTQRCGPGPTGHFGCKASCRRLSKKASCSCTFSPRFGFRTIASSALRPWCDGTTPSWA